MHASKKRQAPFFSFDMNIEGAARGIVREK